MNNSRFTSAAPAPSAAVAARGNQQQQQDENRAGTVHRASSSQQRRDPNSPSMGRDDAGQLVAMSTGPRLNPHSALKEFNQYLLQCLDANDEEKRQIIGRLRVVVQAQRSAAAVREDLMKLTMEFNETQRTAEELRLALQESREAQRRLEHENRTLQAQVEDDRAKIAALVKLCRAEIGTRGGNPDLLLQLHANKKQQHPPTNSNQQQQRRSASSQRATSPLGVAGSSVAAKTPSGAVGAKSVSLRAACTPGRERDADGAEHGGQLVNPSNNMMLADHQQQQDSNTTNDIVAQVLAGTASGSESLIGNMRLECDALKQLLQEQRAAYEASRASHVRVARDCDRRHYEEAQRMAAEIRSLSDLVVTSTKDLCETRQNAGVMQRQLRGEIESLVQRLTEAEKSKSAQSARQTEEMRVLAVSERNKTHGVTDKLRAKLSHTEQRLHTMKDGLEKECEHLKEALATAQETAARERRLRLRAEEHARLKAAGAESDLGLLRAQLRMLEKKAFFAHTKDLSEFRQVGLPGNAPDEEIELPAPEDDNEAIDMHIAGGMGGEATATSGAGNEGPGAAGAGTSSARVPLSQLQSRGAMRYDGGDQMRGILRGNSLGGGGGGASGGVGGGSSSIGVTAGDWHSGAGGLPPAALLS